VLRWLTDAHTQIVANISSTLSVNGVKRFAKRQSFIKAAVVRDAGMIGVARRSNSIIWNQRTRILASPARDIPEAGTGRARSLTSAFSCVPIATAKLTQNCSFRGITAVETSGEFREACPESIGFGTVILSEACRRVSV
jgi:hypothetical protein